MSIKSFFEQLRRNKRFCLIMVIIGIIIFAIIGFVNRNNVNNGIVYCSESSILVKNSNSEELEFNNPNSLSKKNVAIAKSDVVLDEISTSINAKNISMSRNDIYNTIIVKASKDVVYIVAYNANPEIAELMCKTGTESALKELSKYSEGNVTILNEASEPFTATISEIDSTSDQGEKIDVITLASITDISTKYVLIQMVKYGVLGGMIFLCISIFLCSIKILFRDED